MKKKVWDITIIDNPNRVVMGENDEFYTTDTEAFLVFNLQDEGFHPQSAMITLENRNDGSLKSEEVEVTDGDIQWEMPERYIEHSGNWQAQLVYEQMKGGIPEKYTSGVMAFTVNSHIKDKKKPSLVEIENWEKFIAEGTELIETWEDMEDLRQANEAQRQENYQELLDTGVLQTNINTKLEQLEEEYAPRLTEVTAQLAQKVGGGNKAELEDLSPTVLSAIEGGEGTEFNLLSIPQPNSVTQESLSFSKQGDNKFLGKYEEVRMLTNGVIQANVNSRTAIIPIVGGETYHIVKDDSEHFRLGWNVGEPEVGDTVDYYIGNFGGLKAIQEAPHDATHMVLVVSYNYEEPRLQVTTRPMPFFVGYDFIPLENIGGFQSHFQDNIDPFWINDIRNGIPNGNFEDGSSRWAVKNTEQSSYEDNAFRFIVGGDGGRIANAQGVPRNIGDILYLSAEIKTDSPFAGVGMRTAILARVEASNDYEHVSTTTVSPNDRNAEISVVCEADGEGTPQEVSVKNVMGINLTTFFGKGNEPSKEEMDNIVRNYYDGFIPYQAYRPARLNEVIYNEFVKQTKNSDRSNFTDTGIIKTKEVYPVLAAVKTVNDRDNEIPRPIGWLYIVPEPPYRMLYASGSPDNMKYLCDWDITKTYDGNRDPSWYRAFITKDGDIIFVYRGDRHYGVGDERSRQNPIIYPSGDWENPVEIDFEDRFKPTAWLQNCGADYLYNQNLFMFSEYTRHSHTTCNVWKVQKPFTDPDNWEVVFTAPLIDSMKHLHTLNYDPYSQLIYASTGDSSSTNQILSSSDFGETWKIEHNGDAKARVLNLIFTKDKVYWANDDGNHGLYSVDRDSSGVPDFSNITELYKFVSVPPSYATILIDEPYGLLILNRFDSANEGPLPIHFWDIDTQSMHVIKEIDYVGETSPGGWGFRMEAVNWYQARGDNRIVTGFSNPANSMDLLGNTTGDNINRINNLVLQVSKKDGEYVLDISALQDRG